MTEPLAATEGRGVETLRVLIVDDHDLFRTGLRNLLEEQGVHVAGEAGSGGEAVRAVREIAPDVVVMDLNMPGMGGVEATRHIAAIAPLTRVLVLTISDEDADVLDAIMAGACGYLLKDSSIHELMAGIEAASRGESLISPGIAAKVLQRVRATSAQPEIADSDQVGAVRPRDPGPEAHRERQGQRAHRRRAAHQPEDGEEPHLEHPHEAPDRQPHPGRGVRGPQRDRLEARVPEGARVRLEPAEHRPELRELDVRAGEPPRERRELRGGGRLVRGAGDLTEPARDPQPLGLERERLGVALRQGLLHARERRRRPAVRRCVEQLLDALQHDSIVSAHDHRLSSPPPGGHMGRPTHLRRRRTHRP